VASKKNPRHISNTNSYITAFQKEWPGFSKEDDGIQASLVHIMLHAFRPYRKHKKNEAAFSMEWKELKDHFGRDGFNEVNDRLKLIRILNRGYSFEEGGGVTNEYMLTDKAYNICAKVRKKKTRGTLSIVRDGLNQIFHTLPSVISSQDVKGKTDTFWKEEKKYLTQNVPINIKELDKLEKQFEKELIQHGLFAQPSREDIYRRLYHIQQIRGDAHWQLVGRGMVAHVYDVTKTGRLVAIGTNLQNAPRAVRKAALVGKWDYDFENCHYAILQQMVKRYGMDCPHIEYYLHHKEAVRRNLTKDIGLDERQTQRVKNALIAIVYGAHATTSQYAALYEELGSKETVRRFLSTETFKNLHPEVKQARDVILDNWPVNNRNYMTNDCGKGISITKDPNKRMAHLIQGVEAFLLRTALRLYPDDIILLLHDGFVSTRQLDREWIEREVKEVTEYDMELSEAQISMSPDYDMSTNLKSIHQK